MYDKVVDDFLPALKFIPNWFVTSKMIKKLHNTLFTDDGMLFFNGDSVSVTFFGDELGILSVDINNINLDDVSFLKMILKLLFMSDLWVSVIDLNKGKHLKRYKQRIHACSMTSNKMVELLHVGR